MPAPEEFKSRRQDENEEQVDYFYLAIVVSLVVHLFGMLAWNVEKHYRVLPRDLFSFLHKVDPSRLLIENKEKAKPKIRQVTLRFVDANPELVAAPPTNPKFEGARNSRAANEEPANTDQDKPKLTGKETELIRDRNASLPGGAPSKPAPPPPAPDPPQPKPPTKVEKKPDPPRQKPQPKTQPQSPPPPEKIIRVAENKRPQPAPKSPPAPIVKPEPQPSPPPSPMIPMAPPPSPPTPPAQSRPRSLPAARKQAGLPGDKSRMDGGVQRQGKEALDVLRTEMGEYGARMSAAIVSRWIQLGRHRSPIPVGRVKVSFRIHKSGRISDLVTKTTEVDSMNTQFCNMAISDPSPFPRWPTALLRRYPNGYHDVTITFIHR